MPHCSLMGPPMSNMQLIFLMTLMSLAQKQACKDCIKKLILDTKKEY